MKWKSIDSLIEALPSPYKEKKIHSQCPYTYFHQKFNSSPKSDPYNVSGTNGTCAYSSLPIGACAPDGWMVPQDRISTYNRSFTDSSNPTPLRYSTYRESIWNMGPQCMPCSRLHEETPYWSAWRLHWNARSGSSRTNALWWGQGISCPYHGKHFLRNPALVEDKVVWGVFIWCPAITRSRQALNHSGSKWQVVIRL